MSYNPWSTGTRYSNTTAGNAAMEQQGIDNFYTRYGGRPAGGVVATGTGQPGRVRTTPLDTIGMMPQRRTGGGWGGGKGVPLGAAPPAPPPSTGQPALDAYITSTQRATDEAKAANEKRYDEGMAGFDALSAKTGASYDALAGTTGTAYDAMKTEGLGLLEGAGTAEKAAISRNFLGRESASNQSLVSRGLSNTTIGPSLSGAFARDRADAMGAADERINQQRLGVVMGTGQNKINASLGLGQSKIGADVGLGTGKLGFLERRTDTYPDMNQLAALAQLYGQGQVGQQPFNAGSGGGGGRGGSSRTPEQEREYQEILNPRFSGGVQRVGRGGGGGGAPVSGGGNATHGFPGGITTGDAYGFEGYGPTPESDPYGEAPLVPRPTQYDTSGGNAPVYDDASGTWIPARDAQSPAQPAVDYWNAYAGGSSTFDESAGSADSDWGNEY